MCTVGGVAPCPSYKEYGTGSDTRFELNWSTDNVRGDTPMVFYLKATDAAGNTTTVERRWTQEDIKPPEITVTGPEGVTSSTRAAYNLEANEPVTWECSFVLTPAGATEPNTEVDTGCYGGPMSWDINTDGKYVFTFKAKDAAGNTSTVTKTLVLDRVKPTVSITSGPGEGATVDTNSVSFGWNAEDNLEVENVRCFLEVAGTTERIQVDGSAPGDFKCGGTSYTGESRNPATFSNLADGQYTFYVMVFDSAGQWEIATRTFTVNTTPPGPRELANSPVAGTTGFKFVGNENTQLMQSFTPTQNAVLESLEVSLCRDVGLNGSWLIPMQLTLYEKTTWGVSELKTLPTLWFNVGGYCTGDTNFIINRFSDSNIQLEAGHEYAISLVPGPDPFMDRYLTWLHGEAYSGGAAYGGYGNYVSGTPINSSGQDLAFKVVGR
jgi:hypothetical protein